jgi:hypothetical protein
VKLFDFGRSARVKSAPSWVWPFARLDAIRMQCRGSIEAGSWEVGGIRSPSAVLEEDGRSETASKSSTIVTRITAAKEED